jgi:hypothetical protein
MWVRKICAGYRRILGQDTENKKKEGMICEGNHQSFGV